MAIYYLAGGDGVGYCAWRVWLSALGNTFGQIDGDVDNQRREGAVVL